MVTSIKLSINESKYMDHSLGSHDIGWSIKALFLLNSDDLFFGLQITLDKNPLEISKGKAFFLFFFFFT